MVSPYDKAIRHAKEMARRGHGVETCGYKSANWRGAWLQTFEEAKQMDFPLDNFDDDIAIAEENINDNNHAGLEIQQTNETHGVTGLHSGGEPEASGAGKARQTHELGIFAGISNADYHSGPGISSTSLKYADKAMALYHAHMTGQVSFQETVAMRLGTAVHALTLEALDFGEQIAVSKKFGTGKKAKEEKAEFYEANPGKTIITADDYDKCRMMRDSLMALPEIGEVFATGAPEQSGFYIDKGEDGRNNGTGMLCKYRPDWRNDWCILDVKSTTDISAEAFSRTIAKFGYHTSAAHYLEGDRITTGTNHRQFIFAAVESEPPYLAALYVLDEESLELGEYTRRKALNGIKAGRDTGEWPLYNHGITTPIGVPSWAHNEMKRAKI
jgi:exodeoxyribonuclease VIII